MSTFLLSSFLNLPSLLFLFGKDKNDGERNLFREQRWKSVDVVVIVLFTDLSIFLSYVLRANYYFFDQLIIQNPYLVHLLLVFVLGAYLQIRCKQSIVALGFSTAKLGKHLGMGICGGVIAYLSCILFESTYEYILGPELSRTELAEWLIAQGRPLLYVTYSAAFLVAGPLAEECLCRGILYSPYRKKYGPKWAVILSSLFFVLLHAGSGPLLAFVLGIILGILYEKTESIIPSIVAHSVYNFLFDVVNFYRASNF